jgi:hypothetical protein
VSGESPADVLAMAEALVGHASRETRGLWPRAAALVARQALEQAVDEYWRARGFDFRGCGERQKLICLREYLDPHLAGEVYEAWAQLTRACHHHAYELAPTVEELAASMVTVRRLTRAIDPRVRPGEAR